MYRIGVISDTHGLLRQEVAEILQTCDRIFHAGDIDSQDVLDRLRALKPLYAVRGNADRDLAEGLPADCLTELYGRKFYMIHNKKECSPRAGDADFVFYGHSHKYDVTEKNGQIWLNPGSCGKRRFTLPVTMAVIELDEGGGYRILRKDISGEKAVSVNGSPTDQAGLIRAVTREFDKGRTVDDIAKKYSVSRELTEQICRMYSTHPGIDVDGILNRITAK